MRFTLILLSLVILAPASQAAAPRDYAYVLVQGKVTASGDGTPVAGLKVRLRGEQESFVATTDERGAFAFDRLPVAAYELAFRTEDGRVIRRMLESTTVDPSRTRARVKLGRGDGISIRIEPAGDDELTVLVPEPRTAWGRLGKQALIFVALAGLLAL